MNFRAVMEATHTGNNYFFQSLFKNLHNYDLLTVLLQYRDIQTFSKNRICFAEQIILKTNNPPKLKDICLLYIHRNLHLRLHIDKDFDFIDTTKTPDIISQLVIPRTLKQLLIYIYINCPRHALLVDKIPKSFFSMRFSLIKNSNLFKILQRDPNWDSVNNYRLHSLDELLQLLYVCNSFPLNHRTAQSLRYYIYKRTTKTVHFNYI